MKKNKQLWIWIGLVVVVIIVLLLVFSGRPGGNSFVAGTVPTYAPQGQLTSGFPANLVLDSSAQVDNSYSIHYSSSTNQYTAEWTSSKTLNALFSLYENYFNSNGWTITNEMTAYAGTKGLHAENGTQVAGVSVVDNGTSRKITVTYVAQ